MPKLAIYVPKDEMRQIEKWRKKINFSKVFMRALDQEIREQSRVAKASKSQWEAAAEFYKQKLSESCQPLEDAGFELGTARVIECRIEPDEIRKVLTWAESTELTEEQVNALEELIGGDLKQLDATFEQLAFDKQSFPGWRQVAYRGFAKGVAAAWKQVCEKMGAK